MINKFNAAADDCHQKKRLWANDVIGCTYKIEDQLWLILVATFSRLPVFLGFWFQVSFLGIVSLNDADNSHSVHCMHAIKP